ncbi:MAG TPA: hypothetical protein VGD81_14485 [Opitutaceae bacterium]
MKLSSFLLTASVGVNLALGYSWWIGRSDPMTGYAVASSSSSPPAAQNAAISGARPAAGSIAALVDGETVRDVSGLIGRLHSGDLVAAAAELRAAGLSEDSVTFLAEAALGRRTRDKIKDLWLSEEETPYWLRSSPSATQRQRQQAMMAVWREQNETARALNLDWKSHHFGQNKLPFSDEKQALVERIDQDFQELTQQVHGEANGVMLPRDVEKLRYLEAEHRKDLADVLTPEELDAWDARRSQTAQTLRWNLGAFEPTESEFRQLVQLQRQFDEQWRHLQWGGGGADDWTKRNEAEKTLREQIKEALGAERYADYRLGTDHEYRQLAHLERRLELPQGTARSINALRAQIGEESKRIANDRALSYEQKTAALKALAQRARGTIETQLGPEGSAYYTRSGGRWLTELGNGRFFTVDAESNRYTTSSVPRPPQKAPPKS